MTEPPKKRLCIDQVNDCIIHCTTGNASDDLASLQDARSWQTLLRAATIREYEPVTELGDDYTGNEFPVWIKYHRRCRSTFTMKKDLDKIVEEKNRNDKTSHHNTDKTIHSR